MKRIIMAAFTALMFSLGTGANAAELISEKDLNGKVSANVGMVTEYFFRGITQTDKKFAVQGGLDFPTNGDAPTVLGEVQNTFRKARP